MNRITQDMKYRQSLMKYAEKYGVSRACRKYDKYRSYVYFWLKRYDGSFESLACQSRRPHSHPNQHTPAEIKQIQDVRRRNPIHMLISVPPKFSVSQIMGYIKGKSAMMIFDQLSNLKYKFGNRHFWAIGYYVSTVGLNEATIAKYIREQDKHDQATDTITTKELEDPFKGQARQSMLWA